MSDPVGNVEIEDVLSSIRRLVSHDVRPTPVPSEPKEEVATPSAEPTIDRLVLGPSLLVSGPEVIEKTTEDSSVSFVSGRQASDEADVPSANGEAASEHSADEFTLVFNHHKLEDCADNSAPEIEGESASAPKHESSIVKLESQPSAEIDEDDEEEDDGYPLPPPGTRFLSWEHVSNINNEPIEPDQPGDSDYAGTNVEPFAWHARKELNFDEVGDAATHVEAIADEIEPEITATATESIAEEIDEGLGGNLQDESVAIDEAMLREMVADIVRQELQGALGERITRNVRKLVRREIHRALAAHDLG